MASSVKFKLACSGNTPVARAISVCKAFSLNPKQ